MQTVLVSTEWVQEHMSDPNIRLIEVDVDTTAYEQGHIPGAIGLNWQTQLQDPIRRDIPSKAQLEATLGGLGVSDKHTIVLYGDNNNWFAAFAFWVLKIYGHEDVRLMDGGRKKWIAEGRPITKEVPNYAPTEYRAKEPDLSLRAFFPQVLESLNRPEVALVDVRSPQEYTGELIAPPGLMETAQRGGHIPGARNIPWVQAVREDGTFKSPEELRALYEAQGITPDKQVVAYCRIGERSAHTWFVLKYLLGYPNVRNYDGSWTEWGNIVGTPIERETPTHTHSGGSAAPCPQ
ncbi:MAG: sulfurtransferase [Armatimonadetes bacterium JP3_11]|jgi:thiosulfate/3-mercaptopyruvate sulfurtransferase|nr:MAG: sulfurtransferase [Armatimonadetes bacterium CP1_7O]OYT75259.1 MAG: sulfurtransferase [Armatimonadetes bacterium JP3_11]RMH10523.1 MAG: sulfurtransferase [Armatimonadota bacterium]